MLHLSSFLIAAVLFTMAVYIKDQSNIIYELFEVQKTTTSLLDSLYITKDYDSSGCFNSGTELRTFLADCLARNSFASEQFKEIMKNWPHLKKSNRESLSSCVLRYIDHLTDQNSECSFHDAVLYTCITGVDVVVVSNKMTWSSLPDEDNIGFNFRSTSAEIAKYIQGYDPPCPALTQYIYFHCYGHPTKCNNLQGLYTSNHYAGLKRTSPIHLGALWATTYIGGNSFSPPVHNPPPTELDLPENQIPKTNKKSIAKKMKALALRRKRNRNNLTCWEARLRGNRPSFQNDTDEEHDMIDSDENASLSSSDLDVDDDVDDEDFGIKEAECETLSGDCDSQMTAAELHSILQNDGDSFFDSLPCSPVKASLLYYLNSGYYRFDQFKEYSQASDGKTLDNDKIKEEIEQETPTDDEIVDCVHNFLSRHSYVPTQLLACASCGTRDWFRSKQDQQEQTDNFVYLPLRNNPKTQIFKLTEKETEAFEALKLGSLGKVRVPVNSSFDLKSIDLWRCFSVYETDQEKWHLHPELIQTNEDGSNPACYFCSTCMKHAENDVEPPLSIASGIDFGNHKRLKLEEPNLHEQMILSRMRLFFAAIKINAKTADTKSQQNFNVQNKFNYHAIVFPHEGADKAAQLEYSNLFGENGLFQADHIAKQLVFYLVDYKGKPDKLAMEVFRDLRLFARPWVLAQWIIVLQRLNSWYKDVEVGNIYKLFTQIEETVEEAFAKVSTSPIIINDKASLEFESALGSDVAQVQQTDWNDSQRPQNTETTVHDATERDKTQPIRYSYVTNVEQAYLNDSTIDVRQKALEKIANLEDIQLYPPSQQNTTHGKEDASSTSESSEFTFDLEAELEGFDEDDFLEQQKKSRSDTVIDIGRDREPESDFRDDDKTLSCSFPHIFMLGSAYGRPISRLSSKQRYHLLSQYHLIPCRDRRLLGYIFDVTQRIRVMDGVKAYVNGDSASVSMIYDLLDKEEDRRALKQACQNIKKAKSQKLIRKYMRHLRFAGANVTYGAVEGHRFKWKANGLNKRYGPPTCFLTISPTNLDNPRSIRMSFSTLNNETFPASFQQDCPFGTNSKDFVRLLQEHSSLQSVGEIKLPDHIINKSRRAQIAMDNPVAFVQENKRLLNDVLSCLLGLDPEDAAFFHTSESRSKRATKYYKTRKGIFGHALYAIGVTEDHSRGTLHWHLTLQAGLPPYVLQRFANISDICQRISDTLDKMYVSRLPRPILLGNMIRRALHRMDCVPQEVKDAMQAPESLLTPPIEDDNTKARLFAQTDSVWSDSLLNTSGLKQQHKHVKSCEKGKHGKTGCRFNMPFPLAETTRPCILIPSGEDDDDSASEPPAKKQKLSTDKASCFYKTRTLPDTTIHSATLGPRYTIRSILDPRFDDYLIVWETKRPRTHIPTQLDSKEDLIIFLQSELYNIPGFQNVTSPFWTWLQASASEEAIQTIFAIIKQELPNANGYVPTFSPVLSYCTGSHNNTSLLGSSGQAKNALYYLVPYEGKSKFPLSHSLPILNNALHYTDTNESKASDKYTQSRRAKFLLTRTLNQMHLKMEISDYQIAASLLDLPSTICTDRFVVGNPASLSAYRTLIQMQEDQETADRNLSDAIQNQRDKRDRKLHADWQWLSTDEEHASNPSTDEDGGDKSQAKATNKLDHYDKEDLLRNLGFIRKIPIQDTSTLRKKFALVPEVSIYLYRSKDLHSLNYLEYLACCEYVEKKPTMRNKRKGRKPSKQYLFDPRFQGRSDSYLALRMKQKTPLLSCKVPQHPGPEPPLDNSLVRETWEEKANAYAKFYLTLFRPEHIDSNLKYDWATLVTWTSELSTDNSIISKFRLRAMDIYMKGLHTSETSKKMNLDYRTKFRDNWSDTEKKRIQKEHNIDRCREKTNFASTTLFEAILQEECELLSPAKNNNMKAQLRHDDAMKKSLCHNEFGIHTSETCSPLKFKPSATYHHSTVKEIQRLASDIKNWKGNQDDQNEISTVIRNSDTKPVHDPLQGPPLFDVARATAGIDRLRHKLMRKTTKNVSQVEIFNAYADFFLGKALSPPQQVILHGGPGVGKSETRRAICKAAKLCNRSIFATSFNNINAVEMGTRTTTSWLELNPKIHANQVGTFEFTVQEIRNLGFDQHSVVVVEEVSNQAPFHIARLDAFCREATRQHNKAFGGCLVLFTGDLTQLGPVKAGPSLTQAIMDLNLHSDLWNRSNKTKLRKQLQTSIYPECEPQINRYNETHPYTVGATLFLRSAIFELTNQNRSQDSIHTTFVNRMYNHMPVTVEDFKSRGYKHFTPEDCIDDPHAWDEAPVLVATNRERYTLTHFRAVNLARNRQTYVIRWESHRGVWEQKPLHPAHQKQCLQDPCFYEYFVPNCKGFLTENIQRDFGLVNSLPVRYKSITPHPDDIDSIKTQLRKATPGQIITLRHAPISVNVEIQLDPDTISDEAIAQVKNFTMCPSKYKNTNKVLLPIQEQYCRPDHGWTAVRGSADFFPSRLKLRKKFPLEPAFAITVHKSEGRTLEKVIISLSYNGAPGCAFSYAQLHVAMSRVRRRNDIRLLLHGENKTLRWQSLTYINRLKPDPSIAFFFDGYRNMQADDPNKHWQTDKWDKQKANLRYKERQHESKRPPPSTRTATFRQSNPS